MYQGQAQAVAVRADFQAHQAVMGSNGSTSPIATGAGCLRLVERSADADATVFIVSGNLAEQQALRRMAASVGLVAEVYARPEDFLRRYDARRVGCLLLDTQLCGMSGLELQEALLQQASTLPIIVMSAEADVPTVVRALKAGAFDFVEKPFAEQLLLDRIRDALAVHRRALGEQQWRIELTQRLTSLSPREHEVMELMVSGKASKAIAAVLGISPKTVEVHRRHIADKLRARSLADIVRIALSAQQAAFGGELEGAWRAAS